jgi:hypothetical protein
MANDDSLWQDSLENPRSFAASSPGPLFPNSPDHLGNTFSLALGGATDATSSTDSLEPEMLSDIERSSEISQPYLSLQLFQGSRNPIPHGVLYNDTHHKFSPVLSLCKCLNSSPVLPKAVSSQDADDQEFCIIPLTMDCTANPFRVRQECVQGSQYLLHAVLALSLQHLAKQSQDETLTKEMQVHRSTATHLYSEALSKSDALVLLDTLLILVNLDVSIVNLWGNKFGSNEQPRSPSQLLVSGMCTCLVLSNYSKVLAV